MAEEEPAVKVTLTTIYTEQQEMKHLIAERLPPNLVERVGKLEAQVAAQWVVVGLVIVGVGGLFARSLMGG